jgi:hypothetical protein
MQQKFKKLHQKIDEITKLAVVRYNTFKYQNQVLKKQALFYTHYMLEILHYNKVWWSDMTFNIWQGYVISVIIQNTDFINNSKRYSITPGFIYIYQLKKYSIYLVILQRIQDTLNLTPAEQSKYVVVIDGEALIIKA